MRLAVLVFLGLPCTSAAQDISLADVLETRSWILEDATCDDVSSLYWPAEDAGEVPFGMSISLLHVATYLQAIPRERGVSYGDLLLELGAFCDKNPNSHWLEFH